MPDQESGTSTRGWADFDALFVREYGSFLHNVRPGQPGTCTVCSTPVADEYSRCMACDRTGLPRARIGRSAELADRVAFLTYAVERGQAYSVLRGYKLPSPPEQYWTSAATWVVWFLGRHAACAHQLAGATAAWTWATVPSARSGRLGEHPLHHIVKQVWGPSHPEARLSLAEGAVGQARGYDPSRYKSDAVRPGSHVILVDDAWTTGANVQSAATALKAAGAAQVSAMVLGRLLRDDWEPTRRFIANGGLRSPFDPHACPWRGVARHA